MTPTSNKQTRLIIIMILFIGAVAGYVYYSRFTSGIDENIPPLTEDAKDTLNQFSGIQFNFQIFSSNNIKPLRIFGEAPVQPDHTGRINPFNNF